MALLTALVSAGLGACAGVAQEAQVTRGQELFQAHGCYGCHRVGAAGTEIAPDLSRVGRRHSETDLARWLLAPAGQRPMRHMPEIRLTEDDARALAAYLASLR